MTEQNEKTYEMLWDCEFCGTKKLLGKTHRHCPECGAVQDAERRYFPSDDERVAVEDHEFVGADRRCPMCNAPNSARAKFCTECGGPAAEGAEVRGVEDTPAPSTEAGNAAPRSKSRKKGLVVLGVLGLVVAAVAALVFWKKEVALTVTGHTWQREVAIEQFAALSENAWCDQMPRDAYDVSHSKEVRSHKKIPDGEECTTRRVDNKDGTFKEKRECRTKYRKEPVYDDKCRFKVNRWHEVRKVRVAGRSLSETPVWPAVTLPPRPVEVLGAERPGRRQEKYTIHFASSSGGAHTCEFSEAKWRSIGIDTKWKGERGALTEVLDCASLTPVR